MTAPVTTPSCLSSWELTFDPIIAPIVPPRMAPTASRWHPIIVKIGFIGNAMFFVLFVLGVAIAVMLAPIAMCRCPRWGPALGLTIVFSMVMLAVTMLAVCPRRIAQSNSRQHHY